MSTAKNKFNALSGQQDFSNFLIISTTIDSNTQASHIGMISGNGHFLGTWYNTNTTYNHRANWPNGKYRYAIVLPAYDDYDDNSTYSSGGTYLIDDVNYAIQNTLTPDLEMEGTTANSIAWRLIYDKKNWENMRDNIFQWDNSTGRPTINNDLTEDLNNPLFNFRLAAPHKIIAIADTVEKSVYYLREIGLASDPNVGKYEAVAYVKLRDIDSINTSMFDRALDSNEISKVQNLIFPEVPTSGSSGGDPYIMPMLSDIPVKLPDVETTYRLFEQDNNFVNVSVSRASEEHQKRTEEVTKQWQEKLGTDLISKNTVTDGFFFNKVFISAQGNQLMVDMYNRKITTIGSCDTSVFKVKTAKKHHQNKIWANSECTSTFITWKDENNSDISVELQLYKNPHIENGVNMSVKRLSPNATGLLVKNYNPKYMKVPSLTTTKYNKLHRRVKTAKNLFSKKHVKSMDACVVHQRRN